MGYELSKVDVWVGEIDNHPGGLAGLLEDLNKADINLEFVITRHQPEKPGVDLVFLAPIKGTKQIGVAKATGLSKADSMCSIRLVGPDRAGLGSRMSAILGQAGVNIRGLSAASIGKRCVVYFSFVDQTTRTRALRALRKDFG